MIWNNELEPEAIFDLRLRLRWKGSISDSAIIPSPILTIEEPNSGDLLSFKISAENTPAPWPLVISDDMPFKWQSNTTIVISLNLMNIYNNTTVQGLLNCAITTVDSLLIWSLNQPISIGANGTYPLTLTIDVPDTTGYILFKCDASIGANKRNIISKIVKIVRDSTSSIPSDFVLHPNYPNPFNLVTNIRFDLPKTSNVKLVIYNIMGQRVKTLIEEQQKVGYHVVQWDGKNEVGLKVASDVYIYRIEAGEFVKAKKMLFLK